MSTSTADRPKRFPPIFREPIRDRGRTGGQVATAATDTDPEVTIMHDDVFDHGYDSSYDLEGGAGHYLGADLYETPHALYDTFGDDVAVDAYSDGIISESQMAEQFQQDANFTSFDDVINGY
jgi:hypothetical protein